MSVYGYCRISTPQQNIERQERNIKTAFPQAQIIKETFTGTKTQGRKELDKLLVHLQKGDTLVFDSVSRMSRSASEGQELYEELFNRGITLVFLKEPHINTEVYKQAMQRQLDIVADTGDSATDKFLQSIVDALNEYSINLAKKQVQLAFGQAEKEVLDLRQRTKEGILTAKMNGKQIGAKEGVKLTTKKSIRAKEQIRKYNKDFDGSLNNEETWKLIGISKMTFYKYKKEMQNE